MANFQAHACGHTNYGLDFVSCGGKKKERKENLEYLVNFTVCLYPFAFSL